MLQCDSGGEFTNNKFLNRLQISGIQQLISCMAIHTTTKWLGKEKHRHIIEFGLSIMFESKIS